MKKPIELSMVEEFHYTFKHPVLEKPTIPGQDRINLRLQLLREETNELAAAALEGDIILVADGLGDIAYVLYGAIIEFGLQDKFAEIFKAIHESNMSKACSTIEEAEATATGYENTRIEERDGKFFVYGNNGKTLKSINYKPVNIKAILG